MIIFTPNTVIKSADVNLNFEDLADISNLSNPYKFSVYKATNQTGLTDSLFTKILFDTELFDTNNNFTSNRYTAPVSGFYHISGYASVVSAATTGIAAIVSIYKNGGEIRRGDTVYTPAVSTWSQQGAHVSDFIELSAGDYVEIHAYADITSGTSTIVGGLIGARMFGYLVSAT